MQAGMGKQRISRHQALVPAFGFICFVALTAATLPSQSTNYYLSKQAKEDSQACIDCHDDMGKSLMHSAHAFSSKEDFSGNGIGCVGCHDGAKEHIEEPSVDNITTPSKMTAGEQGALCSRCHVNPHQMAMETTDPHALAGLACMSCHTIHNNLNEKLVKDAGENYCASCHTGVVAEFKRRSSHPLEAGQVKCVSCHDLGNNQDKFFAQGHDWRCQSCHGEKSGPFRFEHSVTQAHLVNGGGCVDCHSPHGSPNDRLLIQPKNGVCLQCHAVPPLHRVQHEGIGVMLDCVECHSDIHGSADNPKFLDPEMGTKFFPNCYQSGCHSNLSD
jgi:DmsE family decaheme c-type cytochrome